MAITAVLGSPFPTVRRLVGVGVAGLALLAAPALMPPATATRSPFASTSPFKVPVKTDPAIDPNSAAMMARATRASVVYSNLYAYSVPIYAASATTPRYSVTCAMEGAWGACPLSQRPMPIPNGARPSSGSDGTLVVIDPATNSVGEYWQATQADGAWTASWGAVNSLSGSGWGGASTGAGASRLAGVIRVAEIQRGIIDHALVVQTDNACTGTFRAPALKTDGDSSRSDCLPEGARLQLDPSIDLSKINGITPAERTVARAMQVYGAYVIDRGGAPLSVSFERATDGRSDFPGATYAAAGLSWDYYGLAHVPWTRLRVLQDWNR